VPETMLSHELAGTPQRVVGTACDDFAGHQVLNPQGQDAQCVLGEAADQYPARI
jgi:hypothetical protein